MHGWVRSKPSLNFIIMYYIQQTWEPKKSICRALRLNRFGSLKTEQQLYSCCVKSLILCCHIISIVMFSAKSFGLKCCRAVTLHFSTYERCFSLPSAALISVFLAKTDMFCSQFSMKMIGLHQISVKNIIYVDVHLIFLVHKVWLEQIILWFTVICPANWAIEE